MKKIILFLTLCCAAFPSSQKLPNGGVPNFAQNPSAAKEIHFSKDTNLPQLITNLTANKDSESLVVKIGDDYFDGLYVIENQVNHVAGTILNNEESKNIQSRYFGVNGKYVLYSHSHSDNIARSILSKNRNVTRISLPSYIDCQPGHTFTKFSSVLKSLSQQDANLRTTLRSISCSNGTLISDAAFLNLFSSLKEIVIRNDTPILSNVCLLGTCYAPVLPTNTKISNPFYQQNKFVIPSNIQYISQDAFRSFTNQTIPHLSVPDNVKRASNAFFSVENLEIPFTCDCSLPIKNTSATKSVIFKMEDEGGFQSFYKALTLSNQGDISSAGVRPWNVYVRDFDDTDNVKAIKEFVYTSNGQIFKKLDFHNLDKSIFEERKQWLKAFQKERNLFNYSSYDFPGSIQFVQDQIFQIDQNEKTWRAENEKIFANIVFSQKFQNLFVLDDSVIKVSKNLDDRLQQIRNPDTGYYDFSQIFETSDIPIILTCLSSDGPSFVKDYLTYCKQNDDLETGLLLVRMAIFAARLFHTNWRNFLCDDLFDQDPDFLSELTKFFLPFELGVTDNFYLYELIKNDSIDDFIIWLNKTNTPLSSQLGKGPDSSLFNLALSCGAVQIAKYLSINGIKVQTQKEKLYAMNAIARSGNAELLYKHEKQILNHGPFPEFKDLAFVTSCLENGHTDMALYILDNISETKNINPNFPKCGSEYYMADDRLHKDKIFDISDFSESKKFSETLCRINLATRGRP